LTLKAITRDRKEESRLAASTVHQDFIVILAHKINRYEKYYQDFRRI
jgi:hypothetical protein